MLNDAEAILSMRQVQLERQNSLSAKGVASAEALDRLPVGLRVDVFVELGSTGQAVGKLDRS